MQSTGKLASAAQARKRSVDYCESGPAAGVVGGIRLSRHASESVPSLLTLDVGGTTAKVAAAKGGEIDVTNSYSVGGAMHGRAIGAASSGYTVAVPVLDLVEIGAGGGSIVWVDAGGALRVGPHSAGAEPGPACYGRGGTRATLSDALVAAGVLSDEQLLGGALEVDFDAAVSALQAVGESIGENAVDTAVGAIEVAVTSMRAAVRTMTVERGYDPADFALFACGGLGPTFAGLLAPEARRDVHSRAGARRSLLCLGAWPCSKGSDAHVLAAPIIDGADAAGRLERELDELTSSVAQLVEALDDGVDVTASVEVRQEVEVRYRGQSATIEIDVSNRRGADDLVPWLRAEFGRAHRERYGFARADKEVELVGLRVSSGLPSRVPVPDAFPKTPSEPARARRLHVYDGAPLADVHRRLGGGQADPLEGPIVIERYDSTVLVPPGWIAQSFGPFLRITAAG